MHIGPSTIKSIQREASDHKDKLTSEELSELKRAKGVIFFERSDGIVEADWYSKSKRLEEAWGHVEQEFEDVEYD
jgi:hypothetical protein